MTLLHSHASMFERTPRIAAAGAFACMAASWLSDSMGNCPFPRGNFIA